MPGPLLPVLAGVGVLQAALKARNASKEQRNQERAVKFSAGRAKQDDRLRKQLLKRLMQVQATPANLSSAFEDPSNPFFRPLDREQAFAHLQRIPAPTAGVPGAGAGAGVGQDQAEFLRRMIQEQLRRGPEGEL